MPYCAALGTTHCTASSPVDIGRALAAIGGPLLPGRLIPKVYNKAVPPGSLDPGGERSADSLSREARALIDGISSQMISWGTALGFTRLLAAADQLVPGVSLPWAAYQSFCALSDAARGNLLRCVQTLPFGALLPMQLHSTLGPLLRSVLPEGIGEASLHEDIVIGVACCALLYELTRQQPVEVTRSSAGRAALHRLRQLRAASNVFTGLQQVANGRCMPGSVQDPSMPWNTVAAAAWPLPGALARSGKGKGNASPPKTPPNTPQRGKPGFKIKLSPRRQRTYPGKGVVAGVGAAGTGDGGGIGSGYSVGTGAAAGSSGAGSGSGASEANKEVMFAVLPGKIKEQGGKMPTDSSKQADKTRGHPAGVQRTVPVHRGAGTGPTVADGAQPHAGPSPIEAALLPACLHFHHAQEAQRQVRKARFDAHALRFCVHDRARPLFESLFDTGREPRAHGRDWLVSLPIRERYPRALRDAPIRKYSGLGQMHVQAPRDASALGDDDLYTVATLSMLPGSSLHNHSVDATRILPAGTFRLLEHTQLDGQPQRLLAYFIDRCEGSDPGFRAGFLPIAEDADGFRIEDEETGLTFSSESLQGLLAGIERVSGWRRHAVGMSIPSSGPQDHADGASPAACSLFVSQPPANGRGRGCGSLSFNRRLPFFDALPIGHGGRLLRSCFIISGSMIIIAVPQGMLRTLVFSPADSESGLRVLNAQRPDGRSFLKALGLEAGCAYALEDVVGTLEHNGFIQVLADVVARPVTPQRPRMFHVRAGHDPGSSASGRESGESGEIIVPPLLSTFHLGDERIDYVDHDGTPGTLHLARGGTSPCALRISAGNSPHALSFATLNGLHPGRCHDMATLQALLHAQGFVQLSDSAGGRW